MGVSRQHDYLLFNKALVNLAHRRDLTDGYVIMFRNGEFEHEMEGYFYEALSQAVDRLEIAVALYREE